MKKNGLTLHSAFTLSTLLKVLEKHKIVTTEVGDKVRAFIQANQTNDPTAAAAKAVAPPPPPRRMTYAERALVAKCDMAKKCLDLMERKKTNLSVAADVDTVSE